MAYLTTQKQDGGRYTTLYATVATWSDLKGGRRGAVQQRFYVGRLNADSGKVRVSKGLAGGARVEVDLEVLRRQVKEAGSVAGVEAWLRGLCRAATGLSAAAVGPPHGDLDTALLGPTYVLGEIAHASGLRRCLAEAFGEGSGLALLFLAMHKAVRGDVDHCEVGDDPRGVVPAVIVEDDQLEVDVAVGEHGGGEPTDDLRLVAGRDEHRDPRRRSPGGWPRRASEEAEVGERQPGWERGEGQRWQR